jgi:large repetitive protein
VTRNRFARLANGTAAFQNLTATQNTITWTRSGASPELFRVTFEQSTNGGLNYTFLGNGTRVGATGNFTLSGLSLPAGQNILIRARGFSLDAEESGSGSIAESVRLVFF